MITDGFAYILDKFEIDRRAAGVLSGLERERVHKQKQAKKAKNLKKLVHPCCMKF